MPLKTYHQVPHQGLMWKIEDVEMKGETLPVEFHSLRRLGTDQDRLDEVTEEEMLRANRAVSFRLFEQLAEEGSADDQPPIGP